MTHLDTIPALRAAFKIGREQYLRREQSHRQELRRKIQHGWSVSGEPITIKDITRHAVRVAVAECGTQEAAARRLDVNRGTIRKHLYAVIVLLTSATCSFAQRGTLVTKPVTSSLALPSALVSAPVKLSLTWDIQPGVDAWRVQVGPSRGNWTGSFITLTNRFVLTNGQHYAVRSITGAMESSGAFWPSNRIGELWLTDMTNNLAMLKRFTNAPPEQKQFWGVVNKTMGWE